MKYLYILSTLLIVGLSGCTSTDYKDQLKYYQSTIGEKCMFYLSNDEEISKKDKNFYYEINMQTTNLLQE